MARARFIRPEFFTDEKMADLPFGACFLFAGIWCHADLRGVFEYSPRALRGLIFPMRDGIDTATVGQWLELLQVAGMVGSFEAAGKTWGYVVNWSRHQSISGSEQKWGTKRPPPPTASSMPAVCHAQAASPTLTLTPTQALGGDSASTVLADEAAAPRPVIIVGKGIPTDESKANRRALAQRLRQLGLRATEDRGDEPGSITEWIDLMTGPRGRCRTAAEVLDGLTWIVAQAKQRGLEVQYAKHVPRLADEWGTKVKRARAEAQQAINARIATADGAEAT